jgi:hypothetical protein
MEPKATMHLEKSQNDFHNKEMNGIPSVYHFLTERQTLALDGSFVRSQE